MKILCISHSAILNVNQFLYEELVSRGHVIKLIVPKTWNSGGLGKNHTWQSNEKFEIIPCETFFTGNGSLYFLNSSLSQIVNDFSPDVVFLDEEPWSFIALQTLLTLRKCKKIKLITYTKQNIYKKYPLPFRLIERWVYRRSDIIFSIGDECTEVLRKKGYQGKAVTFPHAVDLTLFPYTPRSASTDVFSLGYIGRFVKAKGGEELILAMKELAQRKVPVELTFMGGGEAELSWRSLVHELGLNDRIKFTEAMPHLDIPKGYQQFDVICLPSRTTPSWKEQFGRVIIEAAATGRPVIGSDSGEIPNVIKCLGNGVIFPEGNYLELAHVIENLFRSRESLALMAARGRERVEELYSYRAIGDIFCESLLTNS